MKIISPQFDKNKMDEYESFALDHVVDEYPRDKSLAEIFQLILEESDEVKHKYTHKKQVVLKIECLISDLKDRFIPKSEEDSGGDKWFDRKFPNASCHRCGI